MKSRKTIGKLALVAGLLGAMVAAPKISSAAPKTTHTMTAKKTVMVKKAASKNEQVTGTITSIKGDVLTIAPVQKNRKGASRTVTVSSSAKVTLGGKSAKLSQLKAGDKVTIKLSGSKVTSVTGSASAKKVVAKKSSKKVAAKKTTAKKVTAKKTSKKATTKKATVKKPTVKKVSKTKAKTKPKA